MFKYINDIQIYRYININIYILQINKYIDI